MTLIVRKDSFLKKSSFFPLFIVFRFRFFISFRLYFEGEKLFLIVNITVNSESHFSVVCVVTNSLNLSEKNDPKLNL